MKHFFKLEKVNENEVMENQPYIVFDTEKKEFETIENQTHQIISRLGSISFFNLSFGNDWLRKHFLSE